MSAAEFRDAGRCASRAWWPAASVALGVGILVAAGLSPWTPGSVAAGVRVPVCLASQLSPVYVDATGAAGSIDREYGFRNKTGRRCRLTGFPRVQMLTGSGAALHTAEQHAPGAYGIVVKRVVLPRHAVAYFGVHYASRTGYGNLTCPSAAALRLTAPGDARGLVIRGRGGRIRPFGGTTVHLRCGIVHVSPVSARRFQ